MHAPSGVGKGHGNREDSERKTLARGETREIRGGFQSSASTDRDYQKSQQIPVNLTPIPVLCILVSRGDGHEKPNDT